MPTAPFSDVEIALKARRRLERPLLLTIWISGIMLSMAEGNVFYLLAISFAVVINLVAVQRASEIFVRRIFVNIGVLLSTVVLALELWDVVLPARGPGALHNPYPGLQTLRAQEQPRLRAATGPERPDGCGCSAVLAGDVVRGPVRRAPDAGGLLRDGPDLEARPGRLGRGATGQRRAAHSRPADRLECYPRLARQGAGAAPGVVTGGDVRIGRDGVCPGPAGRDVSGGGASWARPDRPAAATWGKSS